MNFRDPERNTIAFLPPQAQEKKFAPRGSTQNDPRSTFFFSFAASMFIVIPSSAYVFEFWRGGECFAPHLLLRLWKGGAPSFCIYFNFIFPEYELWMQYIWFAFKYSQLFMLMIMLTMNILILYNTVKLTTKFIKYGKIKVFRAYFSGEYTLNYS